MDLASSDKQFQETYCWDSFSIEHFEISTQNKMAAKIPDFDKYYFEDSCFFQNNDPVGLCVIISYSHTIPLNTKDNNNMVVKLKMASKKQGGGQILNCIMTELNKYRLLHY